MKWFLTMSDPDADLTWKAELPGPSVGPPRVVGERVFVPVALPPEDGVLGYLGSFDVTNPGRLAVAELTLASGALVETVLVPLPALPTPDPLTTEGQYELFQEPVPTNQAPWVAHGTGVLEDPDGARTTFTWPAPYPGVVNATYPLVLTIAGRRFDSVWAVPTWFTYTQNSFTLTANYLGEYGAPEAGDLIDLLFFIANPDVEDPELRVSMDWPQGVLPIVVDTPPDRGRPCAKLGRITNCLWEGPDSAPLLIPVGSQLQRAFAYNALTKALLWDRQSSADYPNSYTLFAPALIAENGGERRLLQAWESWIYEEVTYKNVLLYDDDTFRAWVDNIDYMTGNPIPFPDRWQDVWTSNFWQGYLYVTRAEGNQIRAELDEVFTNDYGVRALGLPQDMTWMVPMTHVHGLEWASLATGARVKSCEVEPRNPENDRVLRPDNWRLDLKIAHKPILSMTAPDLSYDPPLDSGPDYDEGTYFEAIYWLYRRVESVAWHLFDSEADMLSGSSPQGSVEVGDGAYRSDLDTYWVCVGDSTTLAGWHELTDPDDPLWPDQWEIRMNPSTNDPNSHQRDDRLVDVTGFRVSLIYTVRRDATPVRSRFPAWRLGNFVVHGSRVFPGPR